MREIKIEKAITNRNSDSVERYLRDLCRYPLLTGEEEAILAKKIRSGDTAALQQLVNANLRFVVSVAKKYEMPGMCLADLISEGNIGLVKAAKRFDETKGFKFISYAVWWIRQSILHSIGLDKRMIRLPLNRLKGIADLWDAIDILSQHLQRSPVLTELSEFMGLSKECILDYLSSSDHTFSFDTVISDDDPNSKLFTMNDPAALKPDAGLERDAMLINMDILMSALSQREREVLQLAYGMAGGRPLENSDIGEEMGLSAETIRRTKRSALYRLRENKGIMMMREYM